MKKSCVVLVGMLALWALSSAAFAQGFMGADFPQSTGLLPLSSNSQCGAKSAACGFPGNVCLYAGWLEYPRGSVWALQRQVATGTAAWSLRGVWLGASADYSLDRGLGLLISASIFLPQKRSGTWHQTIFNEAFDFSIPSYDWWSVDGLVKFPATDVFQVLAGLRWDHTSVRVNYSDNTSDDYILNAYIPLFGLQICQSTSGGRLLLRAVGTPWVAGRLKYHFWGEPDAAEFGGFSSSNGYFAEVFADYSLRIRDNASFGGFVKWNALHFRTAERSLSGFSADPVSWSVDIKSWTFGASLCFAFTTPFF